MKKIIRLSLLLVLLIVCVACQPTPEEEIVISRDSVMIEEKLDPGTPVPVEQTLEPEAAISYKEQVGAYKAALPAHWSDQITANIDFSIEASIIVDNEDSFPVYTATRTSFNAEQAEAIANVFFQNVTGIREGNQALPEEYAEAIASLNKRGFIDYAEAMFREMQQVPEGSYSEADCISFLSQEEKSKQEYVVQYGDGNIGKITFYGNYLNYSSRFFSQVHVKEFAEVDGSYDGEGKVIVDPSITIEQAEETLNAFLQKIQLDGFTTESVTAARYFAFLTREEISQGWYFVLMRTYGYHAVDTYNLSDSRFQFEDTAYSQPWERETLKIYVSENGVELFQWTCPMEIIGIASQNVELLDFEQVQQNAKKVLTAAISWSESKYWKGEINQIVLTVMAQQVQDDPKTAYLMPVWVFFADWYFDGDYAFTDAVRINALDGSRAIMK